MEEEKYYVTNKNILKELKKYRETNEISEELGRMIMQIAKNYSTKGSFASYTWLEDMISEAVLTCLKYMHNFDPTKQEYPNPFAYFTTIIHNSFINFIRKQKRHSSIKDICFNRVEIIENNINLHKYTIQGIDYQLMRGKKRRKKKRN